MRNHRRRTLGGVLVAFAAAFLIGSALPTIAAPSNTAQSGPHTDNGSVYYCLINTEQVTHAHDVVNQFLSQTVARRVNNCGSSAHPAVIRGQLVGWKGSSVCFATPVTPWQNSNPLNLPLVLTLVLQYGSITGGVPSLPCGNGTYSTGGGHEGWWWPGGITTFQHISPGQYLHNHPI